MKILIACEESQTVCKAFRAKGHEAYSCDIQECSGGHPEWHIMGDVIPLLHPYDYINIYGQPCYGFVFNTQNGYLHEICGRWDMIIAHPPCTYLTVTANKYYDINKYGDKAIKRSLEREYAVEFFLTIANADCDKIAIENPIGIMSTRFRKPDQIIQPYYFGHPYRKSTCLWLLNLDPLIATNIVEYEVIHSKGKSGGYSGNSWVVRDEFGKILRYNDPKVSVIRSKTYPGIAAAMAEQWS